PGRAAVRGRAARGCRAGVRRLRGVLLLPVPLPQGVMSVRTAVVINPTSVVDAERVRSDVATALADAGCPEPLWFQTSANDPGRGQTRSAIAGGAEVVFVCGGDGTVRACADQLAGTQVALAVLPAGTGNLFVANLGLPTGVRPCVEVAVA